MKNILFICSQNRLRSPTAEQVFCDTPGFEVASAGTNHSADVQLSVELVEWADVLFVMENTHKTIVQKKYRQYLNGKRVQCLDIPDDFTYMDPNLVVLLKNKLGEFFGRQ
ncbi:MAG: putative protein tyrosine phosphatase [Candidatus Krumholzibacteriia bacterium]|jgi:predicted protein tyrosine phosphatase